jgi:hypothetical protein
MRRLKRTRLRLRDESVAAAAEEIRRPLARLPPQTGLAARELQLQEQVVLRT